MRLRLILLVLSLQAFFSATIGGYLYYSSLQEAAFKEAEQKAVTRLEVLRRNLISFLSENRKPVQTLAGLPVIIDAAENPGPQTVARANRFLDLFQRTLQVDVCYLMDRDGTTLASSNRYDPDSFTGENFSFRPYFRKAIQGTPGLYLAVGTTSGKRGAYYSAPVKSGDAKEAAGVVVIKVSIDLIERELGFSDHEIGFVADPYGIIFISSRSDWLFQSIRKLSPAEVSELAVSRQFGKGPWRFSGLHIPGNGTATDEEGIRYLVHQKEIQLYPGWRIYHLQDTEEISRRISTPLYRITGPVVLLLCLLAGLSVTLLYRKASQELKKRKQAEKSLRQSEERFRSLYHHTPAMLHSIDRAGNLVSVSAHWAEVLGYRPGDVIGKPLVDFFTEESRRYAETEVLPAFFQNGYCKDIPYRFVKKNGEKIDVLLSAITDIDESGRSNRSLAVSIDVTERKQAELELQQAKEELSRYSRELERKVRERTREITNIFKYIPAAVYLKDHRHQYTLVNSKFEDLFNVRRRDIIGKTDFAVFPDSIAAMLRENEMQVIEGGQYKRFEEEITLAGIQSTYLAVIFPIYGDAGAISGVCGILTDITALKKAQNQLRRLSGSIMDNQERERAAIARELHDELGQVLTALRMDAVWLSDHVGSAEPRVSTRALTMCELIDKTIESVRNLAIRLRPGVLDDLGLVDALEWLSSDFESRTGITCIFEHAKIPEIENTIATAVYRIAQEALTNVARHAGAGRVEVHLYFQDQSLHLTVEDDGRGFTVSDFADVEGLGLAGMRERAGLAGGELDIRSQVQKGTRLVCTIPVESLTGGFIDQRTAGR